MSSRCLQDVLLRENCFCYHLFNKCSGPIVKLNIYRKIFYTYNHVRNFQTVNSFNIRKLLELIFRTFYEWLLLHIPLLKWVSEKILLSQSIKNQWINVSHRILLVAFENTWHRVSWEKSKDWYWFMCSSLWTKF